MLGNLGTVLLQLERYADALEHLQVALEISRKIGLRSNEAMVLRSLAELHQKLEQPAQAREYCDQALAIATKLGIPLSQDCHELRAKLRIYEKQMLVEEEHNLPAQDLTN